MISVFHLEALHGLLEDFYYITRIRITVFDAQFRELVSYPENRPAFCQLIRSCTAGASACAQCDRQACQVAVKQTGVYIYRCHAGLTEAIMPLYAGNVLLGYLLFGHVFAYDSFEAGWQAIRACCSSYPVDMEKLKQTCRDNPRISDHYISAAARILHATASHLILERMATLQKDSAADRLDSYLNANFTRPLTAQIICRELGCGRTRLYKLSQQLYGRGPAEQVRHLRIEKAKACLMDHPDLSIGEIAQSCGFEDYNYFISVFTKETGISPGRFRKQDV